MSTYMGWLVVTQPTTPAVPSSLEWSQNAITGTNTNSFTGQQQVFNWSSGFVEVSVTMPDMTATNGQLWEDFFISCNGTANVFTFPTAACTLFPNALTTDGTTPRFFRLKSNSSKFVIKEGMVYSITFEARAAI